MSGNTSRKYKQYMRMMENRRLFGDITKKNEYGFSDLVAYSAARCEIKIRKPKYDLGENLGQKNKTKMEST